MAKVKLDDKQSSENELMGIANQIEYLKAQGAELQKSASQIALLIQDNTSTLETLKNFKELKKAIFPLGSGVFVNAGVQDNLVLVDIGTRILAEKTPEEAIAILEEKIKKLNEGFVSTQQSLEQVSDKLEELSLRGEALASQRG